jgi:hypothetical protein
MAIQQPTLITAASERPKFGGSGTPLVTPNKFSGRQSRHQQKQHHRTTTESQTESRNQTEQQKADIESEVYPKVKTASGSE